MEGGLVEETSNLQLSGSHSKTLITDGGLKKKSTQFCKITTSFSSIKGTENRALESSIRSTRTAMQRHADQPQQRRNVQVPTPKVEGSSSSGSFVKP
jgi:hypothetical protein